MNKKVTVVGVKGGAGEHLCEVFYIGWFEVQDVEALALAFEVPQIDAQVIGGQKRLLVGVE